MVPYVTYGTTKPRKDRVPRDKSLDNDHDDKHFGSWSWSLQKLKLCDKNHQIIHLEGIFSPTDMWKNTRTCKTENYHNISDTYISQYAALPK